MSFFPKVLICSQTVWPWETKTLGAVPLLCPHPEQADCTWVQDSHGAPQHGRSPLPTTYHIHVFDHLGETGVLLVGHNYLRLHLLASTFNDHLGLIHLKQVDPLQVPQAPEQDLKHTKLLVCSRCARRSPAVQPCLQVPTHSAQTPREA